jgi:hypothetical protein
MIPIPQAVWQRMLRVESDLEFMTEDHHRVRDFVVVQLPRAGRALSPDEIAQGLNMPCDQVVHILDDLERNMHHTV